MGVLMKKTLLALALLTAIPGTFPGLAQTAAQSSDHQALETLNAAWLNSYVTGDADALAAILAEDFVATYSGGQRRTRAQIVGRLRAGPTALSVRFENLAVQVSGDVAVVTARSVIQSRGANGVTERRNDYADIYVRRAGRWLAIAAHIVPAPAP